VYLSDDDGQSFVKVYNLTGGTTTYQNIVLNISDLAAANALNLTSTFIIKFQQYDNYSMTSDGFAFDDVCVTSVGGGPNYCVSQGNNSASEWIESVTIGGDQNFSGNDGGYADYTNFFIYPFTPGSQIPITIEPGYSSTNFPEYFRVFIDLNNDGDFTDSGESKDFGNGTSSVTNTFSVPSNTPYGTYRMRVSMKYNAYPLACESFSFGEVEDYNISLVSPLTQTDLPDHKTSASTTKVQADPKELEEQDIKFSIFPNPASNTFYLSFEKVQENVNLIIFDITGKLVQQQSFLELKTQRVDVSDLVPGMYTVRVNTGNQVSSKRIIIQ